MSATWYLPLVLLLAVARVHAQEAPVRANGPPGPGLSAAALAASLAGPAAAGRLGMKPIPSTFRLSRVVSAAPGDDAAFRLAYPAVPVRVAADSPRVVVPPAGADTAGDTRPAPRGFLDLELPDVVQQATDLAVRVEGRGGLGGAWNQYRPCDPGLRLHCNPTLVPQLRPDIEFGIQVGGTITDRLHVNVDYDQRREFDTANNISVYYEGAPGELVQRLEMGDVSIALPSSRYLTQGIPAGNFGFKATARLGPTEVAAVWAQQKGEIATREFRLGGLGQAGLVQEQERVLDDADYTSGQFFFLVDPTRIAGHPHLDVLTLARRDAPPDIRPQGNRLVVFRDEGAISASFAEQAQAGKFLANATSADGTRRHSGLFRLLEPGQDYYIHSSGLWIALRTPLRGDEALAAGYVTETGVVMGDPEPEARPLGETPDLLLVRAPIAVHQPGQPTWPWEMHHVYRLDSSAEVEMSTLELVISLGHEAGGMTFREHAGRQIPLLRLFGLDNSSPADRIDRARVFRPGADVGEIGPSALRGTFVVFPTLEPFGRPPPVPSEGLSDAETAAILGGDANRAIYEAVDPVVRRGASRFRLNFRYRVQLEGVPSSFNLGAFGIRQGSERITVDDRLLVRGVDYVLDYDIGLVTLLDPHATLGSNPDAEIRATWEQKSMFEIAPTTVFGLHARSPLGEFGEVNLVGLYQGEQSLVRRPQLGMTPRAVMLGGLSGRLAFQADWLANALQAVPFLRADSIARLDITGEMAMSAPDPNRRGDTYLDDFEATDEIPLSLETFEWRLGSAPQDPSGAEILPWPLTPRNAAKLVWQDRYLDPTGREVGFLTAQEIDQQIAFAGARVAERVMYLTMGGGLRPPDPPPHWRSVTTVLSTTGRDLSRSEYLEFYAGTHEGWMEDAVLVIDIGTVSEDAFYFDSTFALSGVDALGRPWGQGVLDEEASLANREVWGPEHDRLGLWGQGCEADRVNPVPLGDARANCTVNNGRRDTEDLNGNGVLDPLDGPAFRYVVPLSRISRYIVRDQTATGTGFRLYRIPLRGPDAIAMHGASEATWRYIQQMRVTVVKQNEGRGTLAVARLRITGSRWTKRDESGVLRGLTGDQPGSGGTGIRVGPVSRLTDGDAYASPPGVEDEVQDPRQAIGAGGVEFNEKGLRLSWDGLLGDERAEVYFRYPQQPRSFLEYRELRFWAVPRRGHWGESGDHVLLVKVGNDVRNYYVYRTPLQPVARPTGVAREDWLPERVVDFGQWFALRTEAERRLVEEPGAGPVVLWSEDGSHGIVLEDRARAPNLAAVRELTFAVYNRGPGETTGEVWLNDIRLGAGSRTMGLAGRVGVDLNAGGFLTASAAFAGRGGRFQQLSDMATLESRDEMTVNATAELGRFAPEAWGMSMPVTVSYARTGLDPLFLQGTDIRAERLPGLRDTGSSRRRIGVTLRKTTPSANPLVGALIDGTALRVSHISLSDHTVTSASRLDGIEAGIDVDRPVADLGFGLVPAFLESALRWLAPRRIEESAFFDRLTDARLRLTPERVGFSTGYQSQDARHWRYERVLQSPADLDVVPFESPRRTLEGGARVAFRPLESVTARVRVTSGRDVLDPGRATTIEHEREALRRAGAEVAGIPIGWERDRMLTADAAYRPVIADWLRPSMTWTSHFGQRRDQAHLELTETGDGLEAELQRSFYSDGRWTRGLIFDPAGALRAALLPRSPPLDEDGEPARPAPVAGAVLAVVSPIRPIELSWTSGAGSRFDREIVDPGMSYQLGLGGVDGLRVIGGDTAATALHQESFRARAGLRIAPGAEIGLGYAESETRVFDRYVGRRDVSERAWPDVQVSWREIPVPTVLEPVLSRWSFSTGFIRSVRQRTLVGDQTRIWDRVEGTVPVELRLAFTGGLAFSYITALTTGDGQDPTGQTEHGAVTHGVDLSGRFAPPAFLATRGLSDAIRLAVTYHYQAETQCRAAGNHPPPAPCTRFIDHMNRRMNVSMSTLVGQVDLGLQGSYVDRRSFVGTQIGSSQFQLGLFGQFNMQAGTFGAR
jgi:hypothetical protein